MSETPRRRRPTTRAPKGGRKRKRTRGGQAARLGKWPLLRMRIAGIALMVLFVLLGVRAWGLQIERNDYFREAAIKQHLSSIELPAPRGVIRDVAGRELAVTADAPSIYVNPREVVDLTGTSEALARICDIDHRVLEAKLSSPRHFEWIRRHVSDEAAKAVEEAKLPGVRVTYEPKRYYPGRSLAGPILGFANIDGVGIEGAELSMNDLLSGAKVRRAAVRDASGKLLLMANADSKAQPGATVVLTIDRTIQFVAEKALAKAVTEHKAKAGSIVVMDVTNGELLAMANWPTYDPNRPASRKKARNRIITDAFEMGSVMKLFTIAGALDRGAVSPEETFDIEGGRIRIGRKVIRDSYHDRVLDVAGVLRRSSNVGTIKIARALGRDGLYETLKSFGFARKTGIELPGERGGLLHPPKRWGEIGLAAVSYGYMSLVTPLQVAAGYAAIGNGGLYNEPRIIREVRDPAGELLYQHELEPRRVISEQTARTLLPMLAGVFAKGKDGGTARSLEINGYRAGGKTGTSHKVDPKTKKYGHDYLSSFAGLAPIDAPRIAVVVLIDEPTGEEHYGSKVAGPAFKEVVEESLRYLGVAPTQTIAGETEAAEARVPEARDESEQQEPEGAELVGAPADQGEELEPQDSDSAVPDFRGLTVPAALALAREHELPIVIEGSGVAVEQSPLPGFSLLGSECRVVFAPQ